MHERFLSVVLFAVIIILLRISAIELVLKSGVWMNGFKLIKTSGSFY